MKDLIKIEERNGEQLVSGRELHEFLEVKTKFKDWFPRMCEYGFVENEDYILVAQKRATNNPKNPFTEINDYLMRISMAKELSMIQRTEKGKQARLYFIECEKRLNETTTNKLPKTYLEALKELVKAEEEKLVLQDRVSRLTHAKKLYTTTEIAKELGFKSANAFNLILEEDKVQYKVNNTWVLTSKYADKEYVSIKQTELDNGRIIYDRKWTGLGRDFLINKYRGI